MGSVGKFIKICDKSWTYAHAHAPVAFLKVDILLMDHYNAIFYVISRIPTVMAEACAELALPTYRSHQEWEQQVKKIVIIQTRTRTNERTRGFSLYLGGHTFPLGE